LAQLANRSPLLSAFPDNNLATDENTGAAPCAASGGELARPCVGATAATAEPELAAALDALARAWPALGPGRRAALLKLIEGGTG